MVAVLVLVLYMLDTIADLCWNCRPCKAMESIVGVQQQVRQKFYAETILDLMTREKDPQGREKILIIGGAIANLYRCSKDIYRNYSSI